MPVADIPEPGVLVLGQGRIEGGLRAEFVPAPGVRGGVRIGHLHSVPYGDPPIVPPSQQEAPGLPGMG